MAKTTNGDSLIEQEEAAPVPRKIAKKKGAESEKKQKPAKTERKKKVLAVPSRSKAGKDAPSRTDIVTQARLYGPASIETLAEVMQCGTEASRVAAAKSLLDRGFGKVDQGWPSEEAQSQGQNAADSQRATAEIPPVPFLDGLAPEDVARIATLVWDEAHRQ